MQKSLNGSVALNYGKDFPTENLFGGMMYYKTQTDLIAEKGLYQYKLLDSVGAVGWGWTSIATISTSGNFVLESGDIIYGDLDMDGHEITGVALPDRSEAVGTKEFIDDGDFLNFPALAGYSDIERTVPVYANFPFGQTHLKAAGAYGIDDQRRQIVFYQCSSPQQYRAVYVGYRHSDADSFVFADKAVTVPGQAGTEYVHTVGSWGPGYAAVWIAAIDTNQINRVAVFDTNDSTIDTTQWTLVRNYAWTDLQSEGRLHNFTLTKINGTNHILHMVIDNTGATAKLHVENATARLRSLTLYNGTVDCDPVDRSGQGYKVYQKNYMPLDAQYYTNDGYNGEGAGVGPAFVYSQQTGCFISLLAVTGVVQNSANVISYIDSAMTLSWSIPGTWVSSGLGVTVNNIPVKNSTYRYRMFPDSTWGTSTGGMQGGYRGTPFAAGQFYIAAEGANVALSTDTDNNLYLLGRNMWESSVGRYARIVNGLTVSQQPTLLTSQWATLSGTITTPTIAPWARRLLSYSSMVIGNSILVVGDGQNPNNPDYGPASVTSFNPTVFDTTFSPGDAIRQPGQAYIPPSGPIYETRTRQVWVDTVPAVTEKKFTKTGTAQGWIVSGYSDNDVVTSRAYIPVEITSDPGYQVCIDSGEIGYLATYENQQHKYIVRSNSNTFDNINQILNRPLDQNSNTGVGYIVKSIEFMQYSMRLSAQNWSIFFFPWATADRYNVSETIITPEIPGHYVTEEYQELVGWTDPGQPYIAPYDTYTGDTLRLDVPAHSKFYDILPIELQAQFNRNDHIRYDYFTSVLRSGVASHAFVRSGYPVWTITQNGAKWAFATTSLIAPAVPASVGTLEEVGNGTVFYGTMIWNGSTSSPEYYAIVKSPTNTDSVSLVAYRNGSWTTVTSTLWRSEIIKQQTALGTTGTNKIHLNCAHMATALSTDSGFWYVNTIINQVTDLPQFPARVNVASGVFSYKTSSQQQPPGAGTTPHGPGKADSSFTPRSFGASTELGIFFVNGQNDFKAYSIQSQKSLSGLTSFGEDAWWTSQSSRYYRYVTTTLPSGLTAYIPEYPIFIGGYLRTIQATTLALQPNTTQYLIVESVAESRDDVTVYVSSTPIFDSFTRACFAIVTTDATSITSIEQFETNRQVNRIAGTRLTTNLIAGEQMTIPTEAGKRIIHRTNKDVIRWTASLSESDVKGTVLFWDYYNPSGAWQKRLLTFSQGGVDVNGNVTASGPITGSSDAMLKDNLVPIANPIEKIKKINGYTYTRISTGEREAGVIAQEIDEVLPEVVYQHAGNSYKSVAYGNLAALFIETIKALREEVAKLEAEYQRRVKRK